MIGFFYLIYNRMKYLKSYENRIFGQNYVSILDEDIEKYLPKKMDIYTMGGGGDGGGNYELELDAVVDFAALLSFLLLLEISSSS